MPIHYHETLTSYDILGYIVQTLTKFTIFEFPKKPVHKNLICIC